MSLLDHLNQISSAITGFANKIPGIAPGDAPRTGMEAIADPDMLRIAQQARERRYRAAYQQAARNGAQWYELGDAAGAAADEGYLPEVAQAAQVGQQRQEMSQREAKRARLAEMINGFAEQYKTSGGKQGLDPMRAAGLGMLEPEDAGKLLYGDSGADRYSMTALGDGAVYVLDKMTGEGQMQINTAQGMQQVKMGTPYTDGNERVYVDVNGNEVKRVPLKDKPVDATVTERFYSNYRDEIKPYSDYGTAYARVKASTGGTPQDDYALIVNFVKMLDPTSVVRESEFYQALKSAGKVDEARNILTSWRNGQVLNAQQRRDYLAYADGMVKELRPLAQASRDRALARAAAYRIDPGLAAKLAFDPFEFASGGAGAPPKQSTGAAAAGILSGGK